MTDLTTSKGMLRDALILVAAILLAFPPAVQAQTGEDALRYTQRFPATGARMLGMAGAGIAGLDDYSAIYTNPAGLAYLRSSAFTASLNAFATQDESLFRVTGLTNAFDTDVSNTRIGHLAAVYKAPTVRGSLVFAGGLNQVHTFERDLLFEGQNGNNSLTDFLMPLPGEFEIDGGDLTPTFTRDLSFIAYETYAIDFDQGLYDNGAEVPFLPAVITGTVLQNGSVIEEGSMTELNFGFAFEAARDVMVGASLNIPIGTYRYTHVFEEEDIFNANDGNFGTTDFDFLRWTESIESTLIGASIRGGVTARITPGVRVGLSLETPTFYAVDEEFSTQLETFFDNGDVYDYGFRNGETAGSGNFDYEIRTPWRVGGGLSFTADVFQVFADAEFIDWSQMELNSDLYGFSTENREIRRDYNPVVNTRVGGEYYLGNLVLRGGFAFQPDRFEPDPRDPDAPRTANGKLLKRDKTFFSAGIGYRFAEQFRVDLGWMQERFDDQFNPYNEVTDHPIVDEEVLRNRFALGVNIAF